MEIRDDAEVERNSQTSFQRCWKCLQSGWCWGMLALLTSNGCALCCAPYDDDYGAYGGIRERTDRQHGRVGSILDPAAAAGVDRTVPVTRTFVPAAGFRPAGDDEPSPCDEDADETGAEVEPLPESLNSSAEQETDAFSETTPKDNAGVPTENDLDLDNLFQSSLRSSGRPRS